jgi:hypothetical protein
MILLPVPKILCVGNKQQHQPLTILIRTRSFRSTRLVVGKLRLIAACSSSYLILLHIRRRADPARTFIAHERTPIDSGTAMNNKAVRSTTVGDTKLRGRLGRARERHADSP